MWGTDPVWIKTTPAGGSQAGYFYYQNDHLGTPQKIIDGQGQSVWSQKATAFGETTVDSASALVNNLRFPGQYFDAETDLHYNGFRDYDPGIGRYIKPDPIGLKGGINSYAYVLNNPMKWVDPLGLYGTTSCGYYSEVCTATGDGYACAAQYICQIFPTGNENEWWQCVRQCLQEEHKRRKQECESTDHVDNVATDHSTCFTACAINSSNPGGSTDITRPSKDIHW